MSYYFEGLTKLNHGMLVNSDFCLQFRIFNSNDSWSDEEDDTVSALMAATSNYWGRPDELVSSFGTCHSIPGPHGPTLPASGDYSAYAMWSM